MGKITLIKPDRDSNPDLPIIGSLVLHESDSLDHAATKAGIGRDLVKRLLEYGAEVVAISRTKKHLDSLEEEVKTIKLKTIHADLSDWNTARRAAQEAGPIDCLVNNAAVAILEPFFDIKPESIDE
uniref:SDR family NAD(P)-dependent oxidoreductase n=1 Tax=Timema tahoe TaxID=61484 RepID=A0A7R9INW6_9NEOP|nr:unnamed protein product [Timema tahoe]